MGRSLALVLRCYRWREVGTPQFPESPRPLSLRGAIALLPEEARISNVALMAIVSGRRQRINIDTYIFLRLLFLKLYENAPSGSGWWQYPEITPPPKGPGRRKLPSGRLRDWEKQAFVEQFLVHKTMRWNDFYLSYCQAYLDALEILLDCLRRLSLPNVNTPRRTKSAIAKARTKR